MPTDDRVMDMAMAHWDYVAAVLIAHEVDTDIINICGFHYKEAFVHGFKHGVSSVLEGR